MSGRNQERFSEPHRPAYRNPDLSRSDEEAEKFREAEAELVRNLRRKQITVQGDFDADNNPFTPRVRIHYRGGPLDGKTGLARNGDQVHEATAANPDQGGNPFVSVTYEATKTRAKDGYLIYEHKPRREPAA